MDFQLTQEQTLLQKMAADFAKRQVAPYASKWDEENHFPVDTLKEAAKLGMGAMVSSETVGGASLKRLDAVLVLEQ